MPIVLIDTNVWVSAFINPHGHPPKVKDAWLSGKFEVVVSLALLEEIAEVLMRPRIKDKYKLETSEIELFLRLLSERAIHATPSGELHICRDPDDDLILETAIRGGAKYAVSRDDDVKADADLIAHMQARGVTVLTVRHFLQRLEDGTL